MNPRSGVRLGLSVVLLAMLLFGVACGTDEPIAPTQPSRDAGAEPGDSASVARSRLSEFEGQLRLATTGHGALVRALADASTGSSETMRAAVGKMRAWVEDQRAWLKDHPPEPCYDAAATKFEAAIDAIAGSADWFEATVVASLPPSDDVSRGSMETEAGNDLQDASRALLDAAALAKTARPNCTG